MQYGNLSLCTLFSAGGADDAGSNAKGAARDAKGAVNDAADDVKRRAK